MLRRNLQAEITQLELEWVEQERLAALKVEAENAMEVEPTPLVEALSSTENLILTQNEVLKPVEAKQTPLPKQKIEQKNIQESAAGKNEETVTEMMIDVGQNKESKEAMINVEKHFCFSR